MLVNDCIDSDGIALGIRPREHSSIPVDPCGYSCQYVSVPYHSFCDCVLFSIERSRSADDGQGRGPTCSRADDVNSCNTPISLRPQQWNGRRKTQHVSKRHGDRRRKMDGISAEGRRTAVRIQTTLMKTWVMWCARNADCIIAIGIGYLSFLLFVF